MRSLGNGRPARRTLSRRRGRSSGRARAVSPAGASGWAPLILTLRSKPYYVSNVSLHAARRGWHADIRVVEVKNRSPTRQRRRLVLRTCKHLRSTDNWYYLGPWCPAHRLARMPSLNAATTPLADVTMQKTIAPGGGWALARVSCLSGPSQTHCAKPPSRAQATHGNLELAMDSMGNLRSDAASGPRGPRRWVQREPSLP